MDMLGIDLNVLSRQLAASSGLRVTRAAVRAGADEADGSPSAHVVVEVSEATAAIDAVSSFEAGRSGGHPPALQGRPLQVPAPTPPVENPAGPATPPQAEARFLRLMEDSLAVMLGRPVQVVVDDQEARSHAASSDRAKVTREAHTGARSESHSADHGTPASPDVAGAGDGAATALTAASPAPHPAGSDAVVSPHAPGAYESVTRLAFRVIVPRDTGTIDRRA